MEKFLQRHRLTRGALDATECYAVEIINPRGKIIDVVHVYCMVDVLRIQKYYLCNPKKFWWSVKVTLI